MQGAHDDGEKQTGLGKILGARMSAQALCGAAAGAVPELFTPPKQENAPS